MEASYLILGAAICGLGALLGMYVADEDKSLKDLLCCRTMQRLLRKFK